MAQGAFGHGHGYFGHPRSYDCKDTVFVPVHYLPLLEKKVDALD